MTPHSLWDNYSAARNLPSIIINDPLLPLISVVTPSFNQGRFIRETIDSVLTQDYPNIEYWVIDGGSTDETISILREYEDDPRFHWISEPDKGQADAINKGWSRCRGDILSYLNSDDTYLPDVLKKLSQFFIDNPDVDIAYGDALRVAEDGKLIEVMYGAEFDLLRLLRLSYIYQPTVLQRKRVIEEVGPLRTHLHYTMDFDLCLRAIPQFSFKYTRQVCATYRMHSNSKTTTGGSAFAKELALVIDEFLSTPSLPAEVQVKRRSIQSDWCLNLALLYLQERNFKMARSNVKRALGYAPFRPRVFFVILQVFDSILNLSLYTSVIALWRKLKPSSFNSR
ncbi:MAG: glycosyltransferase [Chloroflexi bacterium]|nr:glycosyltransferase [Chloroflexota bacterium]